MAYLSVKELTKIFDGEKVLKSISFDLEKGEFLSLLGPSGCGKTTTLRIIAGLENPDEGSIILNDQEMNHVPAYNRNMGIVFQNYALFPHMTVEQNIAYGLEQRKTPKKEIQEEVAKVIELVQLKGFEKRKPKQLSGGQQQRVALARALVIKPKLLLLDESLSALDKKLRVEMQVELREIQKRTGVTTIFITHDQEEAMTLSDKIVLLKDGEIIQMDKPQAIYEKPRNHFVANFIGQANCFSGMVKKESQGYLLQQDNNGEAVYFESNEKLNPNQHYTISVRPEKVKLQKEPVDGASHPIKGKVRFITYLGNSSIYRVEALGLEWKVQQQNENAESNFEVGDEVYLRWEKNNTLILEETQGDRNA